MSEQSYLTEEQRENIVTALQDGRANDAFSSLAAYLETNKLKLSDGVLRLYIENELFECFGGRSKSFNAVLTK